MIDAKDAVSKARDYFDTMLGSDLKEVLLEEAEVTQQEQWIVTFSFYWQPSSGTASIGPGERMYKLLTLDAEGNLISMKKCTQHT